MRASIFTRPYFFIGVLIAMIFGGCECADFYEKVLTTKLPEPIEEPIIQYDLTLTAQPRDGGTVKLDGQDIDGDSVLYTIALDEDTVVTVCALPSDRYEFVSWSGDLSFDDESTNECIDVIMDDDKTLVANFKTCTAGVDCFDDVGMCVIGDACRNDNTRENCELEDGEFTLGGVCPVYHTLTVSANIAAGGTITIDGEPIDPDSTYSFVEDTEVEVCAETARLYTFVDWTGDELSSETCLTVLMDDDKTLSANFRRLRTYTLRVSKNVNGGDMLVTIGDEPTVRVGWNGEFPNIVEGTRVRLGVSTCNGGMFNMWRIVVGGSAALPETEPFSQSFSPTFDMERDMHLIAHFGRGCTSGGGGGGDPPPPPPPTTNICDIFPDWMDFCCAFGGPPFPDGTKDSCP